MAAPLLTAYANGPIAIGADQLNTFMQTCDNAAQMRDLIGVVGMELGARGINSVNDGLGGEFYWNSSATGPDDNMNTIVPTGSASGAWVRLTTASSGLAASALLRTGGTMTGALTLAGDPTSALQAATKQYVDAVSVVANAAAPIASPTFTGTVTIPAGAAISGYLTTAAAASTYQTALGFTPYNATNPSGFQTAAQVAAVLPAGATVAPIIDGTATVGVSALYARQDHVHPTDTSRYAASNPSGFQTAANVSATVATETTRAEGAEALLLPKSGGTMTGAITVAASGQFYPSSGAHLFSLNDRMFLGAATLNTGNNVATGPDYVSAAITTSSGTNVNITASAQFAAFSTVGAIGGLFGSRTSDSAALGGENALALMAVAINNNSANPGISEAAYFEAQMKAGAGITQTVEIDAVNQSGVVTTINPYQSLASVTPGFSTALTLGAGGARSGVLNSAAAMTITNNGALFDKGIVFFQQSIASNEAIALASGHTIQWWTSASSVSNFIQSTAIQTTSAYGIVLGDTETVIGAGEAGSPVASSGSLAVSHVANAVDFLTVSGGVSGESAVALNANGTDTNIDIQLLPKGSGLLVFGGTTSLAATAGTGTLPSTPAGFLEFKAAAGGTFKIPFYNV